MATQPEQCLYTDTQNAASRVVLVNPANAVEVAYPIPVSDGGGSLAIVGGSCDIIFEWTESAV